MNELENFLQQLSEIERKYEAYKENKNDFNFFNVMYKGNEEVTLHSRFISYLLSPNSKHGTKKEDTFLQLFVMNILKIDDFDFNGCEVMPNEQEKSEFEEIDILIVNKTAKQAIIIENKITANDSPPLDKKYKGYSGQLERYFSTIKNGKDKKGNPVEYQCDKIHVRYLSLYKTPSEESIGILNNPENKGILKTIGYDKIQEWLKLCLKEENVQSTVKDFIQQYLKFIIKMSHDSKKALEVTDLLAKNNNWQSIWCLCEQFKHVKWHTVHRFFTELEKSLTEKYEILKSPTKLTKDEKDAIKEATWDKKSTSIVISFRTKTNKELYIANDSNGLTYGATNDPKNHKPFSKEIKFFEFSNEETFKMLNETNRKTVIEEIINEIEKL